MIPCAIPIDAALSPSERRSEHPHHASVLNLADNVRLDALGFSPLAKW